MEKTPDYKKALEVIKIAKKTDVFKYYETKSVDDRFIQLMTLYDTLKPDWKEIYEELESKKPKELQTDLGAESMEDIIDGALYDKLLEKCLSIHTANRVAHSFEYARDTIVKELLLEKIEKGEIKEDLINKDIIKFKRICKQLGDYYDPSNKNNQSIKDFIKEKLSDYGITEEDLNSLEELGIDSLVQARKEAFAAKDFEIDETLKELSTRRDISYGICTREVKRKFERNLRGVAEDVLVIDMPYYGQFIVHMKQPSSISTMQRIPGYSKRYLYEKETFLLTDEISEEGTKFLDEKKKEGKSPTYRNLRRDLKNLEVLNPRFAHYLAIKIGANKRELRDLHNRYEDGR